MRRTDRRWGGGVATHFMRPPRRKVGIIRQRVLASDMHETLASIAAFGADIIPPVNYAV